ncbi:MAG: peptidoglycan-binding protein [Anaerolineae bacterium]|nr:peptidoglycan-binding protein [Anaerolineae bacterium]
MAVGPNRGGIFAPPLTIEGLGQAIQAFQAFQGLPVQDGRVDPGGRTLRRINEILNPGEFPAAETVRPLTGVAGLETAVDRETWTPDPASFVSDFVFRWSRIAGRGKISYFQLSEPLVPRWFGVLVPEGVTSFDKVHIFFHPTPAQAGHNDANYHRLEDWAAIFHYLSEDMGAQFCAAGTDRVLVMPLMTQAASQDAGILPQRWESIVGRILGMLKTGDFSEAAAPVSITSVVVSSFSSGIVYSHQFRTRASLGGRLAGVIDFDGIISSFSQLSAALSGPAGHVVRMHQTASTPQTVSSLAAQKIFPLARPRWGDPWTPFLDPSPQAALLQIHGHIPQTTMWIAAQHAG